jgi:hypothetical protein
MDSRPAEKSCQFVSFGIRIWDRNPRQILLLLD